MHERCGEGIARTHRVGDTDRDSCRFDEFTFNEHGASMGASRHTYCLPVEVSACVMAEFPEVSGETGDPMNTLELGLAQLYDVSAPQKSRREFRRVHARSQIQIEEASRVSGCAEQAFEGHETRFGRREQAAEIEPTGVDSSQPREVRSRQFDRVIGCRSCDREVRLAIGIPVDPCSAGAETRAHSQELRIEIEALDSLAGLAPQTVVAESADQRYAMTEVARVCREVQRCSAETSGVRKKVPENLPYHNYPGQLGWRRAKFRGSN